MSVLAVAFEYHHVARFRAAGIPINSLIYIHRLPRDLDPSVRLISHDLAHMAVPHAFAADLDPTITKQVREASFTTYRRTHFRQFFKRAKNSDSWLDVDNLFENAIQFYWNLLKDQKIETVIFRNVPHGGTTIVLYHLCQALGIRTIVLMQSLFSNRFWASEAIESIGVSGPKTTPSGAISLNLNPSPPFYMKGAARMTLSRFLMAYSSRALNTGFKALTLSFLWNRKSFDKSWIKFERLRQEYRLHSQLADMFDVYVPDRKFVYFPLHLQPEMTTDVLGGVYCDQLLAIEELVRQLPDDVWVYVKENPKQASYLREDSFFTRLKAIPRVAYLPRDTPSFELIERSVGVATITGKAGWEALQMAKPVIVFGAAWFRGLPGVKEWQDDPAACVAQLDSFKFDANLLTAAVAERECLLWPGVLDPLYGVLIEGFDAKANEDQVATSIAAIYQSAS